jgi:hypothetical protein
MEQGVLDKAGPPASITLESATASCREQSTQPDVSVGLMTSEMQQLVRRISGLIRKRHFCYPDILAQAPADLSQYLPFDA